MFLTEEKIKELTKKANDIRQSIIEMLVEAGSGHTAGPLGMADIFTLFYFHVLKHNPSDPAWEDRMDKKDRDRFIYCFMSDGELDEGNSWEAVMLAGKNKLRNLIAIVD